MNWFAVLHDFPIISGAVVLAYVLIVAARFHRNPRDRNLMLVCGVLVMGFVTIVVVTTARSMMAQQS